MSAYGELTEEEREAATAAYHAHDMGIGMVKQPTFPKLNLTNVWKYKWNATRVRGCVCVRDTPHTDSGLVLLLHLFRWNRG